MRGQSDQDGQRPPTDWRWPIALAALVVAFLLVNPVGFIGGGWDDYQYLTAARCWATHGPCLPLDHWQARWPLIAPLAAVIGVLGESRMSVGIVPLAASLACLVLVVWLGNRLFGKPAGWFAAMFVAVTPIFVIEYLDPNVEAVELAFLLLGFVALERARDDNRRRWPIFAGLAFALALQTRETAAVALPFAAIAAWLWIPSDRRRSLIWGAAAFSLPFLVELAVFAAETGDPLWRRRLAIAHTQIGSTELLGPIDRERSPFFNPNYIANWRHEPGVELHWAIDPLLNLFLNAKAGLALLLAPIVLIGFRDRLSPAHGRLGATLLVGALIYACVLIYALAVDPKARMMLMPITACSLVLGLVVSRLWWSNSRRIAWLIVASSIACGLIAVAVHERLFIADEPARRWIAEHRGDVETVERTRRHLALVPEAAALPGAGSRAHFLLFKAEHVGCGRWITRAGLDERTLSVAEEVPLNLFDRWIETGSLCLYRYEREVDPGELFDAIARASPKRRKKR